MGQVRPPGSRRSESSSVRFPGRAAREEKRHVWSAGRRACRKACGCLHQVPSIRSAKRRSLPHFEGERKRRRRLSANDTTGRRNSSKKLRCLTCESESCAHARNMTQPHPSGSDVCCLQIRPPTSLQQSLIKTGISGESFRARRRSDIRHRQPKVMDQES